MTISYIDKRRKETKFVSFRGGRKTCCQVFSSVCKGTTIFLSRKPFPQKKAGNSFFPAFSPRVCTTTHPFSLILTEKKLRQLLPVPLREDSPHIFLARQHRLQQLAQRRYTVRAIAHKFLVYRTHCIDYIVHQRARIECRIPCFQLNYELSIFSP